MSHPFADLVVHHNGHPADSRQLAPLAFAGYAHFTALQVRNYSLRAPDLHLLRLRQASLRLFGRALRDDTVLEYLRTAVTAGPADVSLLATMYSPEGEFTDQGTGADPQMLVRSSAPATGPRGPLSLALFDHERVLPSIKHVGEIAKTHFLRQAVAQGFDDAAFVDRHGRLGEGSIWNLAFWDGESVVWPQAEILTGTTMGIVQRQLTRLQVTQRTASIRIEDLPALSGAVVMNSWTPGVAVHRIGAVPLPETPDFVDLLHRAYAAEPLVSLQ